MQKTLHTLLLLLYAQFSQAQKLIIDWTKFIGGDSCATAVRNAISTEDGGVLFTGLSSCNSKGDIPAISYGQYNLLIGKIGKGGQLDWVRMFGGNQDDIGITACNGLSGEYVIAGNSWSNDGDVSNHKGAGDVWVVKLDENGSKIWDYCYGSSLYSENVFSIKPTPDSGFIILGRNNGYGDDIPSHYTSSQFVYDWFLLKINKSGAKEWVKVYGGNNDESSGCVLVRSDGYYIVAGSNSKDHECADTAWHIGKNTKYDYYILKTDTAGNILWSKSYGSSENDFVEDAIWNEQDSSITIVGSVNAGDFYVKSNEGESDIWVLNVSNTGIYNWSKNLGSAALEYGKRICRGPDSTYWVLGETTPHNSIINPRMIGYSDYWLFALDSSGVLQTDKIIGGIKDEFSFGVVPYQSGLMTIGTSTSNNFTEGKNIGQKGFGDEISLSFLYYFPTHNKLVSVEQRDLKIYPNPANSNFRILLPIPSTTYKVFAEDVSGKLLNKWEVPEGSKYFDIDTSDWKSGSYIITCKGDDNNVYIKRIVKNN